MRIILYDGKKNKAKHWVTRCCTCQISLTYSKQDVRVDVCDKRHSIECPRCSTSLTVPMAKYRMIVW